MGLLFGPSLVSPIPLPLRLFVPFFVRVCASVDFSDFLARTSSNSATMSSRTSYSGDNDLNQQNPTQMERNFPNIFTDGYDSRPNNHPIVVVANAMELMLSFYIRYVNWTLNHEESPPRKHNTPIVSSPPRRKKYKSETSSTEIATNAYSSQQSEVERTYMSSDTSRRSVKKKKTRTKSLVKRLIGIMADLTSKIDRVLLKKDEPGTGVGEEQDMGNEEEEETYYQDAIHTKIEENHQSKEKKAVESPEKENEDIVNEESNDVSNHLLLDNLYAASLLGFWIKWNMISSNLNTTHMLHILPLDVEFWSRNVANGVGGYPKWKDVDMVLFPINVVGFHWFLVVLRLNTWKVHIYDSTRSMDFLSKYLIGGKFKIFGDSIISELDVIEYWNDFPDGHKANATVEFVDTIDEPQQEYIEDRGDCGVFICVFMEMNGSGVPMKIDKPRRDARFLYRNRMTNITWDTI
ncbi:unnamed protein product [Lactuca virosa]|uniref:Ubiquitin-like protease family profile domain-containing protein n=1 Tax=Lactuca virosa TaxID=75947 RepID=A0AAU9LC21_9ASTR|nr:unnamed protein product [Lactuca virosa]